MRRHLSLLLLACAAAVLLAAPPAQGAEPARVVLQTRTMPDGTIRLTATVVDGRGDPVAESPVIFKARTTFGWLTLAETVSGKDGTAQVTLPAARAGEVTVEVGEEGTVRAAVLIGAPIPPRPRIRPGRDVLRGLSPQPGFISPYPVTLQVGLFGGVLAGVWITYGYVVWLLLRIRRERQPESLRG